MKNGRYFKHDVTASGNRKLMLLMEKEGAKGYGMYWMLIETLSRQPDLRAPLSLLSSMAYRCRTKAPCLQRLVENYGLFIVDGEVFYSPGLNKRMQPFVESQAAYTGSPLTVQNPRKLLENRLEVGDSARIEEKRREENFNYSRGEGESAVVVAPDMEPPLLPIRCWESLVDEMAADRSWMDMVGAHSGLGQLYIDHCAAIVDLFRQHIRLYDRGGGLLRLCDVRSYFVNYLSAGSRTCQGVRAKLLEGLQQQKTEEGISPHETLVDGQRTYLGRPIPDEAPPRPNQYAVWDESARKWGR